MNDLRVFNFKENEVRIISRNNEPYFCLKDVCDILEIKNSRDVKKRLMDNEGFLTVDSIDGQNGQSNQPPTYINEANLYDVIFMSRKKEAKSFKLWVFKEVLPEIRKTGSYQSGNSSLTQKDVDMIGSIVASVMKNMENRVSNIENKYEQREALLPAKEKSDRDNLRQIINSYASKKNMAYRDAWNRLYEEAYYRMNINIRLRAENRDMQKLDYAELEGYLPDLLAIAIEIFN